MSSNERLSFKYFLKGAFVREISQKSRAVLAATGMKGITMNLLKEFVKPFIPATAETTISVIFL